MMRQVQVMWVDDDADVIEAVRELFDRWSQFGPHVHFRAFHNPLDLQTEAEQLLRKKSEVDGLFVVTDNSMPERFGWELIRDLRAVHRALNSRIPIRFLMVAAAPNEIVTRVQTYGAQYLAKPMDIKRLRIILDHFLNP